MTRSHGLAILLLLAASALILAACSGDGASSNPSLGMFSARSAGDPDGDGLALVADPAVIRIDVDAPDGSRFGETTLRATALDPSGAAQAGLPITFSTSAGTLTPSEPVATDANGVATTTLRVLDTDPRTIEASATDGTRTATIEVAWKPVNRAPVAVAGADLSAECDPDGTPIALDGSASTDPDSSEGTNDDIVKFEWIENLGGPDEKLLAEGETVEVSLGLGTHAITLRVTDAEGLQATDELSVEIIDTTPPEVDLALSPSRLWPPNHKLVNVRADVDVHDCSPFTVALVSVTSSEPENGLGDGDTAPDIAGAALGTADYGFQLRAERSGGGSGRIYTVVYTVTDDLGFETTEEAYVSVPHDQGH